MTSLFDFHNMFTNQNKNTIVFFKGSFSQEILHELAKSLKNRLADNEEKRISKRIFAIFIELAQNIYHYSEEKINIEEKKMGDGIIHIFTDKDCYIIQSGNVIEKTKQQVVVDKIEMINSKSLDELKQLKKEIIKRKRTREGAGFGLIEIALKSHTKIVCDFIEIDKTKNFIKIETKIVKEG